MLSVQLSFLLLQFEAPTRSPVNVTVKAINSSKISVIWVEPSKGVLHGNLVRYEVECKRVECNESDRVSVTEDGSWKSVNVVSASLSVEISNLVFWSRYKVRMSAVTVGSGPFSDVIDVRGNEHGELLFLGFNTAVEAFNCSFSRMA